MNNYLKILRNIKPIDFAEIAGIKEGHTKSLSERHYIIATAESLLETTRNLGFDFNVQNLSLIHI